MTDIPEDIHDIADDIWILMAANTCGRTELTEIIARAILAERVHAESKLAEARAEALESQINDDRHFFLKAKAAEDRIDKLEKALADVTNPMECLRRHAEAEGGKLNGMAYSIANDLHFVQNIARAALEDKRGVGNE